MLLVISSDAIATEPARPLHTLELTVSNATLIDLDQRATTRFGAGGSATVHILAHLLEFELVAHLLRGPGELIAPIDFIAKHTFLLSPTLHPYVGAGLTVVPVFETHEANVEWGVATAFGIDVWLQPDYGIFLEGSLNLIAPVHDAALETGLALGPIIGF